MAGIAVFLPDTPASLSKRIEPVVVQVTTGSPPSTRPATLAVSLAPGAIVRSSGVEGVVTEVRKKRGDAVDSLDVVGRVGRRPIVAVETPAPFSRDLQRGDRGEDVAMLQQMLASAGELSEPPDGRYGSSTAEAVQRWRDSIGDPSADETFSAGQVLWLAKPVASLRSVEMTVGVPLAAAGMPLLVGELTPVSAEIRDAGGSASVAIEEDEVLLLAGQVLTQQPDTSLGDEALQKLARLTAEGVAIPNEKPELPEGGGNATATYTVELQSQNSEVMAALPGEAVVNGPNGEVCVYAPDGPEFKPMAVTVDSGNLDTVFVPADMAPDNVLVNPYDILTSDVSCTS